MAVEIYSTDTDSGTVSVIRREGDGKHEVVGTIDVGNAPRGAVKFTTDGRGYVCNCGGNTISEIDVLTRREIGRIVVGLAPRGLGIVPGDRYALVSNSGSNSLSLVDLDLRRELEQLAVGRDPRHMAITKDGTFAYVAVWGSHYVSKVDLRSVRSGKGSLHEALRISVGEGRHPYSVAIHPLGAKAYVANTQSERLSVIDLRKDLVVNEIDLESRGARAVAFHPSGRHAFVSVENVSEVAVIDVEKERVTQRIPVGPGPRGVAVDPTGDSLYTASFARHNRASFGQIEFAPNSVTVIELGKLNLSAAGKTALKGLRLAQVSVGAGPCSVSVVDPDALKRVSIPKVPARRVRGA